MEDGPRTSDDELVELYELLTDFGESDIVHAHVPVGAEILELGCGTGRMTRRLLELGHPVTAVDASEVMLSRVPPEATKVLGAVETLDLRQRFPVVLLASNLVNTPEPRRRHRLLRGCFRHVSDDGQVVLERYAPGFEGWSDREWEARAAVELRVAALERTGDEFTAAVEYRSGERTWSHSFSALPLDDAALEAAASTAGLRLCGTLTPDGRWVEMRPAAVRRA